MSIELIGLLGIVVMFLLMFLRVPIAISMAVPAFIGILYLKDWKVLSTVIETIVWNHSFSYMLTTIPMFVLMGEFLFVSGISGELFLAFKKWFGRLRGGLAMGTVGASAIFAAASGSSIATTGTMGVIASKEMVNSGYNKSLAGGSIIAGGSLGILIPPSTMFIIYGMMSEQSIGKLLIAGIVPGILLTILYMLTVYITVLIRPGLAPKGSASSWGERFSSLRHVIWVLILFVLVIGGMYIGLFGPTEAAGIGAFGAFLIVVLRRKLSWSSFIESMSRTLRTTGFLFAIMLSAFLLNYFLAITRLPLALADFLTGTALSAGAIFILIIILYIVLGSVMDTMAMIVVTIPIILPIIQALGFDLIWFGVIIVVVVEMGLMTPPVGMSCFVLNGVSPELELSDIFKGALLFLIPIFVLITLLYFFPEIALYLPDKMW
ncbi:Neu5Ac permease [Sporosarcina sp. P13]|uniref:TRAP transporter large permease n=1 Tax=Sporosarcina sp. P13 TaxID=2048263 RepID=UPI000C16E6B5|nr:TRAP transporter large permease [Sporosarcina sp. P13]PIC62782.1 Neu5Ac permease [Sporosarcina sp. P13]